MCLGLPVTEEGSITIFPKSCVGDIGYGISEMDVLFASQFLLINPCVEETFTFDLCIHVNNELMEKVPAPQ